MSEYIDEPEDEALVRRARGGEAAAFVQLSMRWWTPLYRIGWYLLGSKSGAAQVAEATLLQALRSPGSLPAGVPLRTFVLRLAVRLAMKRRPSSSRLVEHQTELGSDSVAGASLAGITPCRGSAQDIRPPAGSSPRHEAPSFELATGRAPDRARKRLCCRRFARRDHSLPGFRSGHSSSGWQFASP